MDGHSCAAAAILDVVRPVATFVTGLSDLVDAAFGTDDAGDAEILAVTALIRHRSISTTDLRHRSGLSRRELDQFVRRLLADELIEQSPAPSDRRVRLVTLTGRGRDRAVRLEQRVADYFDDCGEVARDILSAVGGATPDSSRTSTRATVTALDLVEELSTLGNRLDAAIRAQHAPKHPKDRAQLTLLFIAMDESARPSTIAERLSLTAGGLTKILNRLERDGLIVRDHDQIPGDRRAVVIELTPDGREVVAAIAAGLTSMKPELRKAFTTIADLGLEAADLERIGGILAELRDSDLELLEPPADVWKGIESSITSMPARRPPARTMPAQLVVEYRIDAGDVVIDVGAGWAEFARANGASELAVPAADRSLWSYIDRPEIRELWQLLVHRVRTLQREVRVPFRCDAPYARRWFEMTVAPARDGCVQFRSELAFEEARPPVALLDPNGPRDTEAQPVPLCSWCGRGQHGVRWLDIEELLRAGRLLERSSMPPISHGICGACRDEMAAELLVPDSAGNTPA